MVLRRKRFVTAVALVALICGTRAWAQVPAGKISGVARDALGAGIPGVTVTATNQATNVSQTTATGNDGSYSFALAPGAYSVAATLSGFRRVAQTVDVAAGAAMQVDFSLEAVLSEEITVTAMKRESTVLDVPFSMAAPTEQDMRDRGVEDIEGVAANVGGFTVQNLGPGQSQVAMRGVSAGQIVRDQPGVKEQVGVVPRRVGHLPLAVHAGRRPLRRHPRGSPARTAGDALRLGLAVGNGPLHHQPAGAEHHEGLCRARGQRRRRRQRGRQRQARLQRPAGPQGRAARRRLLQPLRGVHGRRPARPRRDGERQRRFPDRRAGGRQDRSERPPLDHAAHRLPESRDRRLEPHRRLQYPRQSLHHDAAGRRAWRTRAVHSARGRVHGRFRARRPQPLVQLRQSRPRIDHVLHVP